jgi:hypothetical protein
LVEALVALAVDRMACTGDQGLMSTRLTQAQIAGVEISALPCDDGWWANLLEEPQSPGGVSQVT